MKGYHTKARPKFLNLAKIRLPLTGFVSILHRLTGVALILAAPVAIYLLQVSLASPGGFAWVGQWLRAPLGVAFTFVALSALFYHLFAGLRFLLIDAGMAMNKERARASAGWVLAAAIVAAALVGWRL